MGIINSCYCVALALLVTKLNKMGEEQIIAEEQVRARGSHRQHHQKVGIQRTFFLFPGLLKTWSPAPAIMDLWPGEVTHQKEWGGGGETCLPTKGTKTAHYSKSLLKAEKKKFSAEKVDHILWKML